VHFTIRIKTTQHPEKILPIKKQRDGITKIKRVL